MVGNKEKLIGNTMVMVPDRNDWFYWSRNQFIHFIRWRNHGDAVALVHVRQEDGIYVWVVIGPCWWLSNEWKGSAGSLDEAKAQVEKKVFEIIEIEFPHP